MRKSKRVIAIAFAVVLMMATAGCGAKKGTCEACGKTAVLYRFTATASLLGYSESTSADICKDCLEDAKKAADEQGLGITSYTYEKID